MDSESEYSRSYSQRVLQGARPSGHVARGYGLKAAARPRKLNFDALSVDGQKADSTPNSPSRHSVTSVASVRSASSQVKECDQLVEMVYEAPDEHTNLDDPKDAMHKNWTDSGIRAAVFGFSDGLVTSVSLILGVYIAYHEENYREVIIMSGLAGMIAGGCSMFCGEWISITAQNEAEKFEVDREREHLERHPHHENEHMAQILMQHGLTKETCKMVIRDLNYCTLDKVLDLHAKLELGIDLNSLAGSPWKAGGMSFLCFIVGAIIPIIPWFLIKEGVEHKVTGFMASLMLALFFAVLVAVIQSCFSPKNSALVASRQVLMVSVAVGLSLLGNWLITGGIM